MIGLGAAPAQRTRETGCVPQQPVSDEVAAALGRFFFGGIGPSHSVVGNAFVSAGYREDDPYDATTQSPNKETRVRTVVLAACRRPDRGRELVDGLLTQLRVHGCFDNARTVYNSEAVRSAQRAFQRIGWTLSDD